MSEKLGDFNIGVVIIQVICVRERIDNSTQYITEKKKHKYKLESIIQNAIHITENLKKQEDILIYLSWERIWSLTNNLYNIIAIIL